MAPQLAALILAVSTGYVYPLPSWHVTTQHGEDIGGGLYHMGVDAGFDSPAGTPVYATADGIVREAQERTQFGLVVLVEHEAETDHAHVSVYGHLDPSDVRVSVGQTVAAGDVIGVLGDSSTNGGWSVHLHFGIHKSPYTGDWVYYGHVYDPDTAQDWYNPEKYIPKHLATDVWQPTLSTALVDEDIVGNTLPITAYVGDIGNGVQTLKVKLKATDGAWTTVATYQQPYYEFSDTIDISAYPDGPIDLKLIARDGATDKTTLQRTVIKDPYRYTTPAFFAAKAGQSDAFVTQWSFAGTALQAFFPFSETWSAGGLIAATDDGIVAVRRDTKDSTSVAKFFSASGTLQAKFKLKDVQPTAITFSDDTLVVYDEHAQSIIGYDMNGTPVWTVTPTMSVTDLQFVDDALYLCGFTDTQTKILVSDTTGTIINQFRPFSKRSTTRGCRLSVTDRIIAGSFGDTPGTVAVFDLSGVRLYSSWRPFGDTFTGQIDVASLNASELAVSQASAGQAWVKIYDLASEPVVELEQRIYEESFTNGAQVVSSVYAE